MTKKYNPFKPNSPVFTGMFSGRKHELERLDYLLFQTQMSNPTHILIHGERGIGKTSLLIVANHFAKGILHWEDEKYNFLTIQISIRPETTLVDFAKKLNTQIKRGLSQSEQGLTFLKKTWEFLTNFESSFISYKAREQKFSEEEIIDNTIYSIVDTVKAITEDIAITELKLHKKKDGVVILLDEVDHASQNLNLGLFLRNLSETLVQENANKALFILSGLPKTRDILRSSHESSLRLFEEFKLTPLSQKEVDQVIKRGLEEANKYNSQTTVEKEAIEYIYRYSEGYPHFVQQIGYSAFMIDTDNNIDKSDVNDAMFNKNGALDLIGDRYYKDMYYGKIKKDSYRQILDIMACKFNDWVSRKEIEEQFKGEKNTLKNGIKALRDRNIILSKPGIRGYYRLQWIGFAVWINTNNKRSEQAKENNSV